jgi:hypothetical protein
VSDRKLMGGGMGLAVVRETFLWAVAEFTDDTGPQTIRLGLQVDVVDDVAVILLSNFFIFPGPRPLYNNNQK